MGAGQTLLESRCIAECGGFTFQPDSPKRAGRPHDPVEAQTTRPRRTAQWVDSRECRVEHGLWSELDARRRVPAGRRLCQLLRLSAAGASRTGSRGALSGSSVPGIRVATSVLRS